MRLDVNRFIVTIFFERKRNERYRTARVLETGINVGKIVTIKGVSIFAIRRAPV